MLRGVAGIVSLQVIDATGAPKLGDQANLTFAVERDGGGATVLSLPNIRQSNPTLQPGLYDADYTAAESDGYDVTFSGYSLTPGVSVIPKQFTTQRAESASVILMPSGSTTLISPVELRTYLRSTDDAAVRRIARAVTELLEKCTGRLWLRRVNRVQTFRPDPYDLYMWLDLYPIESLVLDEWDIGGDATTTLADDFEFDAEVGRITRLRTTRWGNAVRATYTGGYTAETVPADAREAMFAQAAFLYKRMSADNASLRSQSVGRGSIDWIDGTLQPMFKDFCEGNRRLA